MLFRSLMQRRLWLLAGAATAVLVLTASATATTKVSGSASVSRGTPAAMPFAQAFAHTPRTVAARQAEPTTPWAEEQGIQGLNTNITCRHQLGQQNRVEGGEGGADEHCPRMLALPGGARTEPPWVTPGGGVAAGLRIQVGAPGPLGDFTRQRRGEAVIEDAKGEVSIVTCAPVTTLACT